jgi:starvation-inducible DNA-binding protein
VDALIKALKEAMADVITFYFMAHGYHWNVEGQDFSQYHNLFGDIYEDVYGSIDPLAENIRKMDDYAPFSLQKFIDLRNVEFKDVDPSPKAMAKSLLSANETVIDTLNSAFDAAEEQNEQGIMDFLASRIDMHKKWAWQLRASTK